MASSTTAELTPDSVRFWPAVLEALRGSRRDYTTVRLSQAVLLLAVPMVIEMALESLFAIVDIFWVSRLGPDAVTAVGLTESMNAIVFAVAMGLSMSCAAMVARRIGEKDGEGAGIAAVQGIFCGVLVSLVVAAIGLAYAPELLSAMGAAPEVVRTGAGYTRTLFGGIASVVLLFVVNSSLRGAGDPAITMRILWVGNGINLLLDPCFIFGLGPFPRCGVQGAAIATTTGRSVAVLLGLWVLSTGRSRLHVRRAHLRVVPEVMLRLLRVSSNGILQFLISTASWVGLMRIMSMFGTTALAGYTIAVRMIMFSILPCWGLGTAAATLVGQNLGARRPDRAEEAVWKAGFYNAIFLACLSVALLAAAPWFVGFFTADPAVASVAVACLRTVCLTYVLWAYGMVVIQAFNGAGDTFTPTVMNFFCYWCWQIPLAWLFAVRLGMGPAGVFRAIAIAGATVTVAAILLFRRGRWKTKRI